MEEQVREYMGVGREVRLRFSEKREIWERIISRRDAGFNRQVQRALHLAWFLVEKIVSIKTMPVMSSIVLFFMIVTGISSAKAALPGDFLYPMKQMGEIIRGSFLFDPAERAIWEATLAERRLEEAEQLVSNKKLKESLKSKVEKEISSQMERAVVSMDALVAEGEETAAVEVGTLLEASMVEHHSMMNDLSINVPQSLTGSLRTRVVRKATSSGLLLPKSAGSSSQASSFSSQATEAIPLLIEGSGGTTLRNGDENLKPAMPDTSDSVQEQAEKNLQKASVLVSQASDMLRAESKRLSSEERASLFDADGKAHRSLDEAYQLFDASLFSDSWVESKNAIEHAESLVRMMQRPWRLLLDVQFYGIEDPSSSSPTQLP